MLDIYTRYGLKLVLADKEVEAGIYDVHDPSQPRAGSRSSRRAQNTLWEYQRYRRDEKGKIVKVDDHAMDQLRYACRPSAIARMVVKPPQTILPSASGLGGGDPTVGY
jgi:hypothetical protein